MHCIFWQRESVVHTFVSHIFLPSTVSTGNTTRTFLLTKGRNCFCFSDRELEACLETMSATTKVMAGVHSPRHSPPSDLCTSISLATTRETPSLRLTRSWWTPPSLPAATHLQAPMPTSTMPTTLPCAASPARPATPAPSAQWKATGPHCHPPSVCRKLLGNYHPKGKLHRRAWAEGPGRGTCMQTPKHCCLAKVTHQILPCLQPGPSLLVLHLCQSARCGRYASTDHGKEAAPSQTSIHDFFGLYHEETYIRAKGRFIYPLLTTGFINW